MSESASYKNAGVDIDKANDLIERIKPLVKRTARKEVMSGLGGFGGLFHLDLKKTANPLLVASTDGVGTKLKIAQMMDKHDTVGIDLVAMSVNDVIVQGAEPLFFLDYIATGRLRVEVGVQIIEGVVQGCLDAGCTLLGGETAEMPGFYPDNEYDLAGFCVGVVEKDRLIDGLSIHVGDQLIGLASSGLHSNGFSLARKVLFEMAGLKGHEYLAGLHNPIGLELLKPTRIYVKPILKLLRKYTIKGIVHITGGGFIDNIPRIVPTPCKAVIQRGSWNVPPIFSAIQELGSVDDLEMLRVFNMGIGLILVVSSRDGADMVDQLNRLGETACLVGTIEKRAEGDPLVAFV